MSDLIADILNQKVKVSLSSESKDQSMSRVMKGKYDFEKYLLENNESLDEFSDNKLSLKDYNNTSNHLNKTDITNLDAASLSKNINIYPVNSGNTDVNSSGVVKVSNDVKGILSKIIDKALANTFPLAKKDNINLKALIEDKKVYFKLSQKNTLITNDEYLRIVKNKNNNNYTLYLNIDDSSLTPSKILNVLKLIESDKNIYLTKVIFNRELILDRKQKQNSDSGMPSVSGSRVNIKI